MATYVGPPYGRAPSGPVKGQGAEAFDPCLRLAQLVQQDLPSFVDGEEVLEGGVMPIGTMGSSCSSFQDQFVCCAPEHYTGPFQAGSNVEWQPLPIRFESPAPPPKGALCATTPPARLAGPGAAATDPSLVALPFGSRSRQDAGDPRPMVSATNLQEPSGFSLQDMLRRLGYTGTCSQDVFGRSVEVIRHDGLPDAEDEYTPSRNGVPEAAASSAASHNTD